jgi:hypothetical protein
MGGLLMQTFGGNAVFIFAVAMLLLWLAVASTMQAPAAVRTVLYHLPGLNEVQGALLKQQLLSVAGVREVLVVAAEQMASIKVESAGFDEAAVENLVKGA